ncbi:MAG: selenium cofactor biosynthesis protein YqeC, partial [Clostridiales bacterium]
GDYIIIEADGAARKPFKAPSDHEPVIFSATTLLLNIVGIDALNKPLTGEFVHRPERIMAITGKKEGDIITSQDIAQVLLSDQGGRKLLPQDSRWLPIINKVDGEKEQIMAEQVAEALKQRGWDDIYFSHFLDDHWQLCRFQEEKVK